MSETTRYIGDGVYAIYKEGDVWLHANDHADPTDKICLEPEVMKELIRFYADMAGKNG